MRIEELMNRHYAKMSENDQYICQCILNHKDDCVQLSIDDFAYKYHVSTSTLSRFAQKLTLPGYSELRTMIRLDKDTKHETIQCMDTLMDCYKKVIDDMDHKDCSILFERMKQANRIIVIGENDREGRVAKEMKRIFLPTGKKLYDSYGMDMIPMLKSFVEPDDVVFIISLHGEEAQLLAFAKEMKMRGIFMTSITKMKSNALSQVCDENLYIQSISFEVAEHQQYEITTPYFILIELLYIKYKAYWKDMNILP